MQIRLELMRTTLDCANLFKRFLIIIPIHVNIIDINRNTNDINIFSAKPPPSYIAINNISINNKHDIIANVRFANGIPSCRNDTIHFNNIKPKLVNNRNNTNLFHRRSDKLLDDVKFGSYALAKHHNARIKKANVKRKAFKFQIFCILRSVKGT